MHKILFILEKEVSIKKERDAPQKENPFLY